ncbi:KH domain-containing protein [Aerococcus vaginalis]
MPNIEELLLAMVQPLVTYPDEVAVDIVDGDEYLEYHLHVHPSDIGRIIGKNGRIVNAMRTILYSIRVENHRRVRLVVEEDHSAEEVSNEEQ